MPESDPLISHGQPPQLDHLPLLDQTWLVSCLALPQRVLGGFPRVLIVLDEHGGPSFYQALRGADCLDQAASCLLDLMLGKVAEGVRGVPRRLFFTERPLFEAVSQPIKAAHYSILLVCKADAPDVVHETMGEIMATLGVKAITDRIQPMRESPRAFATCMWPAEAEDSDEVVLPHGPVKLRRPADDNFGGCPLVAAPLIGDPWLETMHRLSAKALMQADSLLHDKPSLARRYFGSAAHRDHVLAGPAAAYAKRALLDWIWLDYRERRRDHSLAEQLLPDLTDPMEREALHYLICTPQTLYRVVQTHPARCLVLEDILRGSGMVEVHDRRLSLLLPPQVVIPARIIPVEGTHVLSAPGPVIPPSLVEPSLELLAQQGLKTTPKALIAGAHLFGRLWHWRTEQHLPQHVLNTEGEELVVYRAAFHVADPVAVEKRFHDHLEIEPIDQSGRYAWAILPAPATTNRPAVRAWLQLRDGTLRLLATSVSRWLYLHDLLAEIPGVDLAEIAQLSIGRWLELFEDLDSLLGGEPVTGRLQIPDADPVERKMHLAWLSVRNPYLDDLTPQEAGRTPAGWRRVQQLIRCLPRSLWNLDGFVERQAANRGKSIWDTLTHDEWHARQRIMLMV